MRQTSLTARSPSRNTPSAGHSLRWQVSRLAEQGFPSDPRLPDRMGQWRLRISPVTVAGAAAFRREPWRLLPYRIPS